MGEADLEKGVQQKLEGDIDKEVGARVNDFVTELADQKIVDERIPHENRKDIEGNEISGATETDKERQGRVGMMSRMSVEKKLKQSGER